MTPTQTDQPVIQNALLSVSDKSGLTELARHLVEAGVQLYASGGTRRHLQEAGLRVCEVSEYTQFPELMDGRLKTLHPKVHGGILCRHDRPGDMQALADHKIVRFDLVVVNLYPFARTIARQNVTRDEAIEQIDIGGPTLIRGAAKNHAFVTVASDPQQYATILQQIRQSGQTTPRLRRELAVAAFAQTAAYDAAIANYLSVERSGSSAQLVDTPGEPPPAGFPREMSLRLIHHATLRYGENPHQSAALYRDASLSSATLVGARQLHGKPLSYNNLLDLDSAAAIARALPPPGVAVLKHNNPCGAATADTLAEAMSRAWDSDPGSAFGSILGCNVCLDAASAGFLCQPGRFVEAIVAPDFEEEAVTLLTTRPTWKKNVRLIELPSLAAGTGEGGETAPGVGAAAASLALRQIDGGFLCQTPDRLPDESSEWRVVTDTPLPDACRDDLAFAWTACRHVKSNAIVLAREAALVGVGAGQMSRIDAVEIAIRKAGERAPGAVLASDAFFPFADSIEHAARAGIRAIIQPGGSRRDEEVITAANEHELPMVFTGRRHFRH